MTEASRGVGSYEYELDTGRVWITGGCGSIYYRDFSALEGAIKKTW